MKVELPACAFTDRRIKPNHIRVMAALVMHRGISPMTGSEVARETGIDRSDVYRVLLDLKAFGLWDGEQVLFPKSVGENPLGENPLPPPAPLGSPPKPPTPPNTPPIIPPPSESFDREFDGWYPGFPRREGRGQALKAFRTARRKASLEDLTAGRDRYAAACRGTEAKYIRLPATWLNGEGWLDEPGQPPPEAGMLSRPPDDLAERRMKLWRERGIWAEGWGPKPTTRAA